MNEDFNFLLENYYEILKNATSTQEFSPRVVFLWENEPG